MNLRSRVLWAGLGIVLATNAVALLGAAWNRSGEPDSLLVMSERELASPWGHAGVRENSGVAFRLDWRILRTGEQWFHLQGHPVPGVDARDWITEEKLLALGFDKPAPSYLRYGDAFWREDERDVVLVLELDGAAYRASVQAAQDNLARVRKEAAIQEDPKAAKSMVDEATRALTFEERHASRLFVIDAGLDLHALHAQYPDSKRHAFVRGRIAAIAGDAPDGRPSLRGYISDVAVTQLHLPVQFHPALQNENGDGRGKFLATIAWGQRLEPWVVDVQAMGTAAQTRE